MHLQAHLHDLLLAEGLERHVLALVLDEHDLPKGARPQHRDPLQVRELDVLCVGAQKSPSQSPKPDAASSRSG